MDKKYEKRLIADHIKGMSYRTLGSKYGIGASTAYGIVMKQNRQDVTGVIAPGGSSLPQDDVAALKAALREEQLRNELLNTMIDIASKELGVDIRKKSGTR